MSEKTKLTMNNTLLSIIILLLSVIGYFYIDETHDQKTIDTKQTTDIDKLVDIANSHNTRLTKVETKIGLY
jgi:hypothetical protein|tara:strand:+ start:402 stop:614 length:213 start_codon:yes stop_codon:yes gene_type:complete